MKKESFRLKQYRGIANREKRKREHVTRAELEHRLLDFQQKNIMEVFTKDVDNDFTPTKYFIVEFNLEDEMCLAKFRNILSLTVCDMLCSEKD